MALNCFSSTRRTVRQVNTVRVKGLGLNNSYLACFFFFFFHGSVKKFNQLARKKKKNL